MNLNSSTSNDIYKLGEKIAEPDECKLVGIVDLTQSVYSNLIEIEQKASRLGIILFGNPPSDMCVGEPDCLMSNIKMALDMTYIINEELGRIIDGLGA